MFERSKPLGRAERSGNQPDPTHVDHGQRDQDSPSANAARPDLRSPDLRSHNAGHGDNGHTDKGHAGPTHDDTDGSDARPVAPRAARGLPRRVGTPPQTHATRHKDAANDDMPATPDAPDPARDDPAHDDPARQDGAPSAAGPVTDEGGSEPRARAEDTPDDPTERLIAQALGTTPPEAGAVGQGTPPRRGHDADPAGPSFIDDPITWMMSGAPITGEGPAQPPFGPDAPPRSDADGDADGGTDDPGAPDTAETRAAPDAGSQTPADTSAAGPVSPVRRVSRARGKAREDGLAATLPPRAARPAPVAPPAAAPQPRRASSKAPGLLARLRGALARPDMMAFLPAAPLAWEWHGPEGLGLTAATALGVFVLGMRRAAPAAAPAADSPRAHPRRVVPMRPVAACINDAITGLPLRPEAVQALDDAFEQMTESGHLTAAFVIGIDGVDDIARQWGDGAIGKLLRVSGDRLKGSLREYDLVVRLEGPRLGVVLDTVRKVDLETAIQIANRMQATLEEPVSIERAFLHPTVHVGFCLMSRTPEPNGTAMLGAAETAAEEARRIGGGSVRAYTDEVRAAAQARSAQAEEAAEALEAGDVVAQFRPQISTHNGQVVGFEVVPCWMHPLRGMLTGEALTEVMQGEALSRRLTEVMFYHAFGAMRRWDRAGLDQAEVSMRLTLAELTDPQLPQRLAWEMDRFAVTPPRLRLELPEAAVAEDADEVVTHSVAALGRLGCRLDLASFGAGPASITGIRRAGIQRLRIARSFIAHVDTDPGQQAMVGAVLSVAERLRIETLAGDVASLAETAMLAQLGCDHVQGPGIARPMAPEDTIAWVERHRNKLAATPRMPRFGGNEG
ncbi:GGDEF domain-containing protein [Phaeovulum vinaykumarii]|uniref:Diguanylate cyclase (GGDEF) domain-containing protein n=1 Tax=Phaeovulum vinaykumarii TaxID=407234 RepID=A0A1N7LAH1_9RHOB|nr:GGDEF domain-containing protein [Phaeovulum vinaykumarii]SIS70761.1 diguanylate cyclase (GGDEF) domain-containing protein [Phaeovulum vinaykumarii]SOB98733.1 diguanylate cyclase (GGDEF)-like protein [Phaeovulum vinaykumarii]